MPTQEAKLFWLFCKIDSSFFFSLHDGGGGLMKVCAHAVALHCLKIMELAESAIFPGNE
ncbi:hypothetical protein K6121_01215 [Neisseria subflava]|uniref:hypothetical protein n=1 Tax=Neisseria subflava TaxID=28449 RepID=UPI001C9909CB|nr:hypothetical protein [Neisseria subflava]MBY6284993.1 hypothetical protein [Neisseria subflava]